jgi:hypothetical protein
VTHEMAKAGPSRLLVLDSLGTLYAIQDNRTYGTQIYTAVPTDAALWMARPLVVPGTTYSNVYLGRDDGRIQQLRYEGGQPQGIAPIDSISSDVYPASFTDAGGMPSVVAGSNSFVARFKLPFCLDDPGA